MNNDTTTANDKTLNDIANEIDQRTHELSRLIGAAHRLGLYSAATFVPFRMEGDVPCLPELRVDIKAKMPAEEPTPTDWAEFNTAIRGITLSNRLF